MEVSSKRLTLCNFKLNVLLTITQAINESLSIDELLSHYQKILKNDLNIGKIIIFKINKKKWECILSSGYKDDIIKLFNVEKDLLPYDSISFVTASPNPAFESTDIIIPIINKNIPLAYILIGDIDEDVEGISPTIKHLHFIQTLSNLIIVAIENISLRNDLINQEAIRRELDLATKMQHMLIPEKEMLPDNERIRVKAFYHPHLEIGGDYYDFVEIDEKEIGFCIADVSGKGISAALIMSNFQANLRALFNAKTSIIDLIGILNSRMVQSAKGERFITLFIAKYNFETKILEYVNAGHVPPIVYETTNNEVNYLNKGCVGIGMLEEIPIIKKGQIKISQHTKLLCFTDGLVDILNEKAIEDGTKSIELAITNNLNIEDNIQNIIKNNHLLENNISYFDDITILGVELF